ncbi:MAG: peroxidase [Anaerolineae bacterium]|nr:peroxidase [Anaerolineae bacterium]
MTKVAWIATIEEEDATGALKEAYDECADRKVGRTAHILKVHSLNPLSMVTHRRFYRALMFGPSPLKRYQREMIGALVSTINGCHY